MGAEISGKLITELEDRLCLLQIKSCRTSWIGLTAHTVLLNTQLTTKVIFSAGGLFKVKRNNVVRSPLIPYLLVVHDQMVSFGLAEGVGILNKVGEALLLVPTSCPDIYHKGIPFAYLS